MARNARSSTLETRSARLRLPIAKKPVFVKIGPGVGLGYRRNRTAGTWVARVADGRGGNWTKAIGVADDYDEATDVTVLDFWAAQQKARELGRGERDGGSHKLSTIAQALAEYETDLKTRGGDMGNIVRIRAHLTPPLADRVIALLSARELRKWRDSLAAKMAPASINRTCRSLKAALNLAAENDARIANARAWKTGLAALPDTHHARNVILDEATVRRIVTEAYCIGPEFGLLVETAAVTGARLSQLARLEVQDVQANRTAPRLMMPSSRKGGGRKVIQRRPVPITPALASKLKVHGAGRPSTALLLTRPSGKPWASAGEPFARAAREAGQDPAAVTMYALRHSSIVRQLLAGVPIRVVAVNHDTSVTMLERTYSQHIGDHSDALARAGLIDLSEPALENVVPIHGT
jgi:integrase